MSYKLASRRTMPPTLAVAVARCGVRNALRPFLRREDTAFMAVLLVPEETVEYYKRAVASLIQEPMPLDEDHNEMAVVIAVSDGKLEARSVFDRLRYGRQVVVVTDRLDRIPVEITATADVVQEVLAPTASHFLAASREARLPGMTLAFAEFFATQSFDDVSVAVRPSRPLLSSVRQLRRLAETVAKPVPRPETPVGPRLEDMHGYGAAGEWGLRLAQDVAAWRRGEIAWEDVDRGALLCGPPGCGKTTYAKALAASCGVHLVVASAARWQAAGHLGDYLKAMRASFQKAKAKAPSILFLDEFDSFGSRDVNSDSSNHDYKRQAVNALLECLDPSEGREGVVVIGATNDASAIDPALLRPGRLEVRIDVPLPDASARVAILRQHLQGHLIGGLPRFASATRGWTGADLEKLARDVRRTARRASVPVSERLVIEALPERRAMSQSELRRIAAHEAGHAVVGTLLFPGTLDHVYVERDVPARGLGRVLGEAVFELGGGTVRTAEFYDDRIAMLLGGIAAENVMCGGHSDGAGGDPSSDLAQASDVATLMERHYGLGDALSVELGMGNRPLEYLRERDPDLRRLVEARLRRQFDRAVGLVSDRRCELEWIVERLLAGGRVEGPEVEAMLVCIIQEYRIRRVLTASGSVPPQLATAGGTEKLIKDAGATRF